MPKPDIDSGLLEGARVFSRRSVACIVLGSALVSCSSARVLSEQGMSDTSWLRPGMTLKEIDDRRQALRSNGVIVDRMDPQHHAREWTSPGGVTYRVYSYETTYTGATVGKVLLLDAFSMGLYSFADAQERAGKLGTKERRTAKIAVSFDPADVVVGVFPNFHDLDVLPADGVARSKGK
jgi:hypothetical protein